MKDKDFIEVSEYVDKQKSGRLSSALLERASESNSFILATQIISQSSDYDLQDPENIHEVRLKLADLISEVYFSLEKFMPYPQILDILILRHQFRNLNTAWETYNALNDQPPVYIEVGDIAKEEYYEFFIHKDPFESNLPDYLLKAAQLALQKLEIGQDAKQASLHFAKVMYARMLALAAETENDFILNTVKTMIDFHNSTELLKVKSQNIELSALESLLIEGGNTQSSFFISGYTKSLVAAIPANYHKQYSDNINFAIQNFERTGDFVFFETLFAYLLNRIIQKVELVTYGAEVPFAYILNIEYQVHQIIIVLSGISEKKSSETIINCLQLNLKNKTQSL